MTKPSSCTPYGQDLAAAIDSAQRCPNCPDQGWYAEADPRSGDPVQVQCEFCYTLPDSMFNVHQRVKAALLSEKPLADTERDKDAASWRYLRSNVRTFDKMIGYCSRQWVFESDCQRRTVEEAVDYAMHPERT